jgi:hypothetical protein
MDTISNAELIELTLASSEHIHVQYQYWLSITFALIVACFVARDQLLSRMRIVLGVMYLVNTFLFLMRMGAAGRNSTLLTNEVLARGIEWTPQAGPMYAITQVSVVFVGVCAALWFLYSTYEAKST